MPSATPPRAPRARRPRYELVNFRDALRELRRNVESLQHEFERRADAVGESGRDTTTIRTGGQK